MLNHASRGPNPIPAKGYGGGGGIQNARGRGKSDFIPTTEGGAQKIIPCLHVGGGGVKSLGETSKFPTVG